MRGTRQACGCAVTRDRAMCSTRHKPALGRRRSHIAPQEKPLSAAKMPFYCACMGNDLRDASAVQAAEDSPPVAAPGRARPKRALTHASRACRGGGIVGQSTRAGVTTDVKTAATHVSARGREARHCWHHCHWARGRPDPAAAVPALLAAVKCHLESIRNRAELLAPCGKTI